METKSPVNTNTNTNTNLPSTQTAHSDIPMVVENYNHNQIPHTSTGTGTGTETSNEINTSHAEINTQSPLSPPSYNAHADQHLSEKRTVESSHHGSNETPPQFQIHPEVSMNTNANGGRNVGEKYEGQHPAPLTSLQKESRLVRCPRCGVCEYTGVEWVSGGTADISALLCCLCFCLPCVPYLMTSFKDVHHKCANCGFLVAVWKRSGKTEVSVAASAAAASGNAGGTGGN
ncbi:putative transcription factor lps-induced tumor necrosis factor alpha protein [Botrytis fragariae]|uniref:Putative transcription factor lps-induced tumor necrosis factor alpha protein n=1 Tax=Botrytis fragariae TaxID=1964551 RepID=A0A8H6AMT6_9HELO|nr:putative transcription factor lps-induced tumor necrosis factor alpha protein [Botrytis fragariae]KAF5870342.1 putative transcription factor lps-induced tumor necrosis factor alpha protein [Botrytis fragariae]